MADSQAACFVDAYRRDCTMHVAPDGRSVRLGITGVACVRVGQPWYEDVDFEHVARVLGKEGAAVHAPTQMRLDAARVAGLLAVLQRFADTGEVKVPEMTTRGFRYLQFTDADGAPCSLQESSVMPHLWLGPTVKSLRVGDADVPLHTVHEALVRDMDARDALLGIVPPPHPAAICEERGSLCLIDRMHLSRKGVAALLLQLRAFLDTGSLGQQQEDKEEQEDEREQEDEEEVEEVEEEDLDEEHEGEAPWRVWFKDSYQKECTLQVAADGQSVHLGPTGASMRLDKTQVTEFLPMLQHFAATGELQLPETTPRGFGYVGFVDADGLRCSLQESSVVPRIWFGTDDVKYGRMHLTRKGVAALLVHLRAFAESLGEHGDRNTHE